MGYIDRQSMIICLSPIEVFRRFVWNFFRLENEHLNNCGKFRAVRDISVAPMESSDQEKIISLMDDTDGPDNRRKTMRVNQACLGNKIQIRVDSIEEEFEL